MLTLHAKPAVKSLTIRRASRRDFWGWQNRSSSSEPNDPPGKPAGFLVWQGRSSSSKPSHSKGATSPSPSAAFSAAMLSAALVAAAAAAAAVLAMRRFSASTSAPRRPRGPPAPRRCGQRPLRPAAAGGPFPAWADSRPAGPRSSRRQPPPSGPRPTSRRRRSARRRAWRPLS